MAEDASNKRRLNSGAACEGCRRRKSRCDAVRPRCSNCQIRSIPCNYVPPPKPTPRKKSQLVNRSSANTPADEVGFVPSTTVIDEGLFLTEQESKSCDSSSGSSATSGEGQTYFGDSSTFTFVSDCSENGSNGAQGSQHAQASISLRDATASHRGSSVAGSLESHFVLPNRALADQLVDAYFSRYHTLYPFLHEGNFRAEYEAMWEWTSLSRYESRLPWFGVLNMVLAHGCEMCGTIQPQHVVGIAAPFVARSRGIILSHVFKSSTLETIQSLLLMCYYLQGTVELDECWNLVGLMIRTAIGLGLHWSRGTENLLTTERELRKRAWWGCFVLDRTLSMKFGRPPSLRIEEGDVELPLEVDDQYIINHALTPRQPNDTPSTISFFVASIKLSQIVYNMMTELYLRGHEKYNDHVDTKLQYPSSRCYHVLGRVILLDGQLQSWWDNAPHHLTEEPNDRGRSWMGFQSQRIVLRIRFLHIRLLLHRQTFLYFSRNEIKDDFRQAVAVSSARICIDCARRMIDLINTAYSDRKLNALSYNAQYIFTSMCVLWILERMDQDERSLLGESMDNDKEDDCYQMGMELLEAACQSSSLAARYVAILQQLRGERIKRDSYTGERNHGAPAPKASASQTDDYCVAADSECDMAEWVFNPSDPVFESYLDFTDLDGLLFGTGSLGAPSVGAT